MKKLCTFGMVMILSCTPYVGKRTTLENPNANTVTPAPAAPPKAHTATFLDTLNSRNEIGLEQNDFIKNQPVAQNEITSTTTTAPRYRIQLFASSQIESLRAKKREIEGSIKLPLVIVFETPYYKLLAGDFAERSEAEANITKLKKMGYADAWIVSSKANIITN